MPALDCYRNQGQESKQINEFVIAQITSDCIYAMHGCVSRAIILVTEIAYDICMTLIWEVFENG